MRKIYYNPVIVIDGAFKGVIGELVSVEMSLNMFPKCTIRVDYDNEITVLQYQIKKIEIEGENDMPPYSLSDCLKSLIKGKDAISCMAFPFKNSSVDCITIE